MALLIPAMTVVLAFGLACTSPGYVPDDVESAEILGTVQRFFDAMAVGDAKAAGEVLLPDATYHSIREDGPHIYMQGRSNASFLETLETLDKEHLERFWEAEVLVHGRIAVVWTPYDFHIGGAFSHCGVDAFTLVKTKDGWRIAGGVYTVERLDCIESPLGPPAAADEL
jgi:ketosteroid isomerase-like protein